MSVATTLSSGKRVSASRMLGGARLCCSGDAARVLGAHHFSGRVAAFVAQSWAPAGVLAALADHFYYAVCAPLGALLADAAFLDAYARAPDRLLYAVCVGAPASADGCAFAWLPDGTLVLSVDAGTYAQLGVQAPRTPRFNARAREVRSGRRFVRVNVRAPAFRPGRPLHDALVAALSAPRARPLRFALCCTDRAGRALDVVFPHAVTAAPARCRCVRVPAPAPLFASRTVLQPTRADVLRACFPATTADTAVSTAEPPSQRPRTEHNSSSSSSDEGKDEDTVEETRRQVLKWAGLCVACPAAVARDTMALTRPETHLDARHVATVERDGWLVAWDGLVPGSTAAALWAALRRCVAGDEEDAKGQEAAGAEQSPAARLRRGSREPWGCVYAWGVHSAPVCWRAFEHEELMGQGENDVVAFVARGDGDSDGDSGAEDTEAALRSVAFLAVSAHDEFSGIA